MKYVFGAAALACAVMAGPAIAQDYPSRPITMIVPYTPGGATDIIGRVIAEGLRGQLGQSVIVENVAGAGGSVGALQASRTQPDGYTILMGALTSHSINMNLTPPPGFDLTTDFETAGLAGFVPLALVTRPGFEADDVAGLIEMAKAAPGELTYASSGAGSPQHLGMEMLKDMAGLDIVHVPYQGSSPAVTDLMGGHVDVMIDTVPSILPSVSGGGLRVLGVATQEPSPFLEGVPTIASGGVEGFEVVSWFGVLLPKGTPDAVADRLNTAINAVLTDDEVLAALNRQGVVPAPGSRADQAGRMQAEIEKWRGVIAAAGPME
ncbi:tripartite tricarboxylate transporter substrate binding protein [Aureimonas altamirensis]|uniref:Bug family tripartite tricarboxylate transporter substrate binding protein n=1 Tax=Aureimonas altamirensis TaxID=370622 RepID=UPI0030169163